jgi:hypothetical protein
VGYVQRSDYVEAIKTSQKPNDSSRKSDSGTTGTASQTLLRSKREAAESRASPCPRGKLRKAEQVRVQEGSCGKQSKSVSKREAAESRPSPSLRRKVRQAEQAGVQGGSCGGRSEFESKSRHISRNRRSQEMSTRASPQRVVYPSIVPRQVSTCSIHA